MDKLVFDIGATNTKFALMSPEGEILARETKPTNYQSVEDYLETMVSIAQNYRESADGILISTNGRMKLDGTTYRAYANRVLEGLDLKAEMQQRCQLPVTVINDGSAAAIGEWWKGAGKETDDLLVIVLGSGLGAGVIINGELYEGPHKNAAALFNMITNYENKDYSFASITTSFVAQLYQLAMAKGELIEEMSGERYFELVVQKDPIASQLFEGYCREIAVLTYNAAMLLDMDHIVITGGLAEQDLVIDGVNKQLAEIRDNYLNGQLGQIISQMLMDPKDVTLQVKKGGLTRDANLYGAFYHGYKKMKEKE